MADTQYEFFRDLDRHCVAGGTQEADCLEAVRRKRACLESTLNCANPVAREVLEGRTTFAAVYDSYSHAFRGVRRFLPMPHDDVQNERLEHLAKIVPNVRHFTRRSVFAADNPVTCTIYAIIASLAISLIWDHAVANDNDHGGINAFTMLALAFGFGFVGFFAGLFAMFKYRTRDPDLIHAREAAVYMDLNYNCQRTFDDEAWAKFVALKTSPPGSMPLTAPGSPRPAAAAPRNPAPAR